MKHTSSLLRSLLFNLLSVVVIIVLCLVVSLGEGLSGAENAPTELRVASPMPAEVAATKPKTTKVTQVTPTVDLRDALAISVRERNLLREQVTQLQTQKRLIIGCVMVITGVAIWLGRMILKRGLHPVSQVQTKSGKKDGESDVFPADTQTSDITSVIKRKNATITIRNSLTQKEEISEQIETRRFFTKDDDSKRIERRATATVMKKTSRIEASPAAQETELRPSTDRTEKKMSPIESTKAVTATLSRPKTVRVDHQSDRLAPVDVALKPGTAPIIRQSGFSILEVMISMAILATVLASVISSVYTLHYSRTMAKERTIAHEISRMIIERIMAAPASSLASSNNASLLRPRFLTDENISGRAQPLTQQQIKSSLENFNDIEEYLLANKQDGVNAALGLNGLKVFVEYYRIENLIYALQNDKPLDLDDNGENYAGVIYSHRTIGLNENLDDRLYNRQGSMTIRVVVKWTGITGIIEQSEQIFARGL